LEQVQALAQAPDLVLDSVRASARALGWALALAWARVQARVPVEQPATRCPHLRRHHMHSRRRCSVPAVLRAMRRS
jgi:hypothetical protein